MDFNRGDDWSGYQDTIGLGKVFFVFFGGIVLAASLIACGLWLAHWFRP